MTIIGGFGVPTPTPPRKEIPVEHEWNWKHIAIAAIAVASILGLIATISLFNTNPATTTTSSGWQPPPEPANPGGWIPPDEPNEPATTPTPEVTPDPEMIEYILRLGYKDLNDTPLGFLLNEKYSLYVVDFKIDINNAKITGAIENRGNEPAVAHTFRISFKTESGYSIPDPNDQKIEWQEKVTRPKYTGSKYQGILIEPGEKVHFVLEMREGYDEYFKELCQRGAEPKYVNFY